MDSKKKVLDGKCSYCFRKIESKFKSCYLCNKRRMKEREIIKNCFKCGKEKNNIYKYCMDCFKDHKDDWKENKNIDNNNGKGIIQTI